MKTRKQQKSSLNYYLLILFILILSIKNSDAQLYYNTAVVLNGNPNSYLTATPNTINITDELSLEAWIFPTSNSESCLIRKGASQVYYGISINSSKVSFLTNNAIRLQSISTIPLNKWTHVVACYDGDNTFRIYINGVLDNLAASPGHSPLANTDSLYIGKKGTEAVSHPFKGYLDEIRIWNRLLDPTEISGNFRTSLVFSNSGVFANLKASYTFQSDNPVPYGSIYSDNALNGNTLTPHNVNTVDFSNTPSRNLSSNESLKLDGDGDYLSIASSASCNPVNEITIEAWVYIQEKEWNMAIVGKNIDISYYLGLTLDKNVVFTPRGFDNGFLLGNKQIPKYEWTHIAATYQTGIAKIYVNGILDDSSTNITGPIAFTYEPMLIGAVTFDHNPDMFFEGYLDCVRISDFVKTQNQIKDFMYQSIDQINRININANELSFNFDGYGSSSTIISNDVGLFYGDAKFSNPATKSNVPVSPVNRLSSVHLEEDWFIKTCLNRRIPETGTTGNTKTDSLYIPSADMIGGLKLFVALNHTKVSDLEVVLVTPSGDSVKVYDKQLLPQTENELITIFDDNAYFSIGNNYPCVSFSPTVKPNSSLSNLYNGSMLGYWKLKIRDTKANDTGRVYSWGIYNDVTLPVELSALTASVHLNNVTLNWTTETETNNLIFEIERFGSNRKWNKIGDISGNSSTSSPSNYSFTDRNLSTGNYNYRIKQVDYNGNFEYFNLNNEISIGVPLKYDLSQNYPNPFNPSTKINFNIPDNSKVTLQIFDISGRLISTLINNESMNAAFYTKQFDGTNFSSGVYFYKLSSNNFTMTKKMTLIK